MSKSDSIYDQVVWALAEFEIGDPESVIPTILIQDGVFLGHRFRYDRGCAMWWLGSPTLEFHDQQGNLFRVVTLASLRSEKAA